MNLYDLVLRNDRAVKMAAGKASAISVGHQRAIRLGVDARVRLRSAHEFIALQDFPREPGWSVLGGGLKVSLSAPDAPKPDTLLCGIAPPLEGAGATAVALDWPAQASKPFDLWLAQRGAEETVITTGPVIDPRRKLSPFLVGRGVEVGPGLAPRVLPAQGVDVEYVEEKTPDGWKDVYGKGKGDGPELTPDVLERYRVGSAVTLDAWPKGGLDFVFSNHVFEHLMNPMQVLLNWLERVKTGGVIAGVVPDARFTFDLRQPLSTRDEFLAEFGAAMHLPSEEKYLRWTQYTQPANTAEGLRARNYSIHVHYYSPNVFRSLVDAVRARGVTLSLFMDTAANNKDFGFVLTKH